MQKKLQRVAYYPVQTGKNFIKDLQLQIIYAKMGGPIEVFKVADDPYAFEFEATDRQKAEIQFTINEVLKQVMNHNKSFALYILFMHGLYFGPKPAITALYQVA